MNKKMKKVVAGVVLGTFTFGVATPAFACNTQIVVAECEYSTEQTEAIVSETYTTAVMAEPMVEERGKAKVALEVIKRVLLDNWDDIPFLKNYSLVKTTVFDLIDKYYDVFDTVEEVLRTSISEALGVDPNSLGVNLALTFIMLLLPL